MTVSTSALAGDLALDADIALSRDATERSTAMIARRAEMK